MNSSSDPGPAERPFKAGVSPLLEIRGLGIGFGTRTVLADIDLTLDGPGTVVLMGPGGTGKSTLLHSLAGVPTSRRRQWGSVRYRGRALEAEGPWPALVHQQARDLSLRLIDGLAGSLRERTQMTPAELRRHIEERLQALDMGHLYERLDETVVDLPTAEVRQASILRAAFAGSPLILIDEPTTGLSEQDAARVLDLIERLSRDHCCLVTLHHQAQARRIAQRAVLMAGGRIQADAAAEDFFANRDRHPVLAQFLRTGSCFVPAPDALPGQLDENIAPPPPLPEAARQAAAAVESVAPAKAVPRTVAPLPQPISGTTSRSAPESSRGPNGFHWLVPGRLAGCPMPGVVVPLDHDLALLRAMGITRLINLTEREIPQHSLARHGLQAYHLRIEDRHAPPLLWAKLLLAKMDGFIRNGEVLAVHCLAGLGRTGTILGAWLVREGLTAEEALRRLRLIEPGFVQSREQEELLYELEANLLIRARD